jgi:hypothetical protein
MKILSLCDLPGNMIKPWANAGHECWIVDIQHPSGVTQDPEYPNIYRVGCKVEDCLSLIPSLESFDMAFAFPPCTDLANSGARWWKDKGVTALHDAVGLVKDCWEIMSNTKAWMLENPVGRLSTHWMQPHYKFDPCDFGGYLAPAGDAYTKKTCLWVGGDFKFPKARPVTPIKVCAQGSWIQKLGGKSLKTKNLRSATPMGFAIAVYEANKGNKK